MNTAYSEIRKFLKRNFGKPFTDISIIDESGGRYLKDDKVVNSFLVRYIKINIAKTLNTGEIGKYLYDDCKEFLYAHDFWTTKRQRVAFWYSWADEISN